MGTELTNNDYKLHVHVIYKPNDISNPFPLLLCFNCLLLYIGVVELTVK